MDRNSGRVVAFFDQAREVSLGTRRYLEVSSDDLLVIAANPAMRAEFTRQLKQENDLELKDQVIQFVLDLADAADDNANEANRRVDLLDRAGLGIAASVTATGIGATTGVLLTAKAAVAGSLIGPIGTLTGGLIGLVVSAFGRQHLKRRADASKSVGQKLRRLVGK